MRYKDRWVTDPNVFDVWEYDKDSGDRADVLIANGVTKAEADRLIDEGAKGYEHRPERCEHAKDDGCEWCCMKCNTDTHWCPECGAVSNHKEEPCNPC